MLKRTSLVVRLFVIAVMAIGLGTLMTSNAAAQTTIGQCQTIIDGVINQDPCEVEVTGPNVCQVTIGEDVFQNINCFGGGCPQQFIINGDIYQFQCGEPVEPTATPITPTATPVTPTATPITPTATPVTPTQVPPTEIPLTPVPTEIPLTPVPTHPVTHTATATHDGTATHAATATKATGGQANPDDKEMEVSVLPSTGQGPDGGQSDSANMLLLGAMGAVLTLGAVAMRMRSNR